MPPRNIDIGSFTPNALAVHERRWAELNRVITPDHPRYPEFAQIATEARLTINRMVEALRMPNGSPMIEQDIERLSELYEQAVLIRADMVHTRINGVVGVPAGQSIGDSFEQSLDPLRENRILSPIAGSLQSIANGLDTNPAEVMEGGTVTGNRFFQRNGSRLAVNFAEVNSARNQLRDIRQNQGLLAMRPDLAPMIGRLEAGLQQMDAADPVRASFNNFNVERLSHMRTDYTPLRIIGGIGGTLVAGLGLANSVFRGRSLGWPMALYTGIAALSINPSLLQGGTGLALDRIAGLNTASTQAVIASGFRGESGANALEELQEIRRDGVRGRSLNLLTQSEQPVTPAQIGNLTENPNSSLAQMLLRLPEQRRMEALRVFGRRMNQDEQELMSEFVRTRDQIQPLV